MKNVFLTKKMGTFGFILIAAGAAWFIILLMLAIVSVGGNESRNQGSN